MTVNLASPRFTLRPSFLARAHVAAGLIAALALGGCALSTELEVPPEVVLPTDQSLLESCLLSGGELTLRNEVDNNDVTEHGDVISFAVSGDRLAVGTVDGVIKLWGLDGFLATLSAGSFSYGPELASAEARDLAFLDGEIVSGDARGLVSAFQPTGEFRILGGTTPGTSITAVAVASAAAPGGARLAHADVSVGGNLLIRVLDGDAVIGPLTTGLETITDLRFVSDGTLVVAGAHAASTGGGLERYDATGTRMVSVDEPGIVRAIDSAGDVVAAVTGETLSFYDTALALRGRNDAEAHAPLGVALSTHGHIAFTVGADETLVAWSTATGEILATIAVPSALLVDTTPDADTAFVAARDGMLRAYGCSATAP